MTDYIRREDALFALRKAERGGSMTALTRLERAYAEIRELPAADVAEVVRCRDCVAWKRNVGIVDSPNGHCFEHDIDTNGRDFCSYGERLMTPSCEGERGMEGE